MACAAISQHEQLYGIYTYHMREAGIECSFYKMFYSPLDQFPNLWSHRSYIYTNFGKNADRSFEIRHSSF